MKIEIQPVKMNALNNYESIILFDSLSSMILFLIDAE